ncbi:MAG: hypothetical protein HYY34_03200 [Chloroflexi bacterium]|nr:hypothetical protein [Chloroflexota bacterium]
MVRKDLPFSVVRQDETDGADAMGHKSMEGGSAGSDDEVVHVHAVPGSQAFQVFQGHAPGTCHFACEISGHKEAGMVGTEVVEG